MIDDSKKEGKRSSANETTLTSAEPEISGGDETGEKKTFLCRGKGSKEDVMPEAQQGGVANGTLSVMVPTAPYDILSPEQPTLANEETPAVYGSGVTGNFPPAFPGHVSISDSSLISAANGQALITDSSQPSLRRGGRKRGSRNRKARMKMQELPPAERIIMRFVDKKYLSEDRNESPDPFFEERFARIQAVAGVRTQAELAWILDIRQSSISDANRRGSLPSDWYMKLFETLGINPLYLKYELGPERLLDPEAGITSLDTDLARTDTHVIQQSASELLNSLFRLVLPTELADLVTEKLYISSDLAPAYFADFLGRILPGDLADKVLASLDYEKLNAK